MSALAERVAAVCAGLPGAVDSDPWGGGHHAWKVGGKMFACIGAVTPGVSVKTPEAETARMLIETGVAQKAPYFHRSWVLLPEDVAADELEHRLHVAYDKIRGGLSKTARAALPPREDA